MIIRTYEPKDIDSIVSLALNLHDNYEFKLDEFSNILVCEYKNQIISFLSYSIIYERAEIIDIYVLDKYRKNKIGTKMFQELIKICTKNGCENITLEVNENNKTAIAFYKQLGFKIEAVRKNYYDNSDGYLMKKDLR